MICYVNRLLYEYVYPCFLSRVGLMLSRRLYLGTCISNSLTSCNVLLTACNWYCLWASKIHTVYKKII